MIPLFKVHFPTSALAPLGEVLTSGFIGQGQKVAEFETLLQSYFGQPNVFTVNSGTMALQIAIRIVGVKPGDWVISTAMTCSATNMAIKAVGANIVWADIDPETGNICPDSVTRAFDYCPRPAAIMAVHWGGSPCDLDALTDISEVYGAPLVEDAAHALGAEYGGRKIGNHGAAVAFSTQAIKHINTIEGGIVVCRSRVAYSQGKLLRWFGIDREGPRTDMRCEQDITQPGYKGNLVDPLAVIGIEQMRHLPGIVAKHQANAAFYNQVAAGMKRIRPLRQDPKGKSAYWLYSVLVDDKDKFRRFMGERGIMASAVHSRNDVFMCFRDARGGPLPGVHQFSQHQVAIPVHWALYDEERERIAAALREYDGQ